MRPTLPPAIDGDEEEFPEPPRLRALRRLVTALTVVLGLGMIVIAGTVAWRLANFGPAPVAAPAGIAAEALRLPAGREVVALGASGAEILVLTRDAKGAERLMIFRRDDGRELSDTPVLRGDRGGDRAADAP